MDGLQNWNPFGDDSDTVSDDIMFGQEFDRLRSGSQSSKYSCLLIALPNRTGKVTFFWVAPLKRILYKKAFFI